jgi:hypothetical protein
VRGWRQVAFLVAVLAVGCLISALVYRWTDSQCRARGGHTEVVYGGRPGWTCSGAQP